LETEEPLRAGTGIVEETVSFEVEVLLVVIVVFETVLLVVMVVFETVLLVVMVVFEIVMVVFEMVTFVALQGNMNTGIVKVILEYL